MRKSLPRLAPTSERCEWVNRLWAVGRQTLPYRIMEGLRVTRSESSKLRKAAPHGVGDTPWSSDQLRQLPCLFQPADSALIVT